MSDPSGTILPTGEPGTPDCQGGVVGPDHRIVIRLGARSFDATSRALVMGILNRTPDSFFDKGAYYDLEAFLRRADEVVVAGADLLDIGGVKAGPGPEVGLEEELERVVPAVELLRARFDLPLSVDTWRAAVAEACFACGATVGNDISGFADPRYLDVAATARASVVATHIRLAPRVADPEPTYPDGDVVGAVEARLSELAGRALRAGLDREQVILDAGLDLGKSALQSLELLRCSDRLAALGYPLLLSASNKTFLGVLLDLSIGERREASMAALALGVARGCRVVRVHDVAGARRVVDTIAAVLEAKAPALEESGGSGR